MCMYICRRFGAKCGGCEQEIGPSELVRRARSRVYHLKCFTCVLCNKQLSTGEELYMLDENRFICKDDYLVKFQGILIFVDYMYLLLLLLLKN